MPDVGFRWTRRDSIRARVPAGLEVWWPFLNLSAAHFAVEGLSRAAWVSNFDQTPTAKEHMRILGRGAAEGVLAIR